jgi:hypothetical protein
MFPLFQSAFPMRLSLHYYQKGHVSSFEYFASNERETRPTAVVIPLEPNFSKKNDGYRSGCESYAWIEINYRVYRFHELEAQFVL